MPSAEPRALRNPESVIDRRSMLNLPHIAPLREFSRLLRREGRGAVPDFDPLDGGVEAKILFLMEKPGPMTDDTALGRRVGSGFISRGNDDPSAEATWRFMADAGIERSLSVIWNVIPWWNGTRTISRDEQTAGIERLSQLVDMLPNLCVVVGVGRKAGKAKASVARRGLPFIISAHPSPINRAARPAVWAAIPDQWARALSHI